MFKRLAALAQQADELSPHYRFRWIVEHGKLTAEIAPKYPGAELDDPIGIRIRAVDERSAEELRAALERVTDYGIPLDLEGDDAKRYVVEVMGPEVVQTEQVADRVRIQPAVPPSIPPGMGIRVVIEGDDEGEDDLSQEMDVTSVTRGKRGMTVSAVSQDGALAANFKVDFEGHKFDATFEPWTGPQASPQALLDAYDWLEALSASQRTVSIRHRETDSLLVSGVFTAGDQIPLEGRELVEKVETIQRHSGIYFPMPHQLSRTDLFWLDVANDLVQKNEVSIPWDGPQTVSIDPRAGAPRVEERQAMLFEQPEMTVTIAGHEIPLGPGITYFGDVRIRNAEEVNAAIEAGTPALIEFEPLRPDSAIVYRLRGE